MKEVIATERIPIKLWLKDMEDGALEQAKNLANLPFAFKHIPIMPDSHQGYGMPIGSILATHGAVVPNAVGVDIGCGMCALRTSLTDISQEELKQVLTIARKTIPVGFESNKEAILENMPDMQPYGDLPIVSKNWEKAIYQLGTLGGGNHFIEIQKGDDGYIWIMIHSGSRNLGYTVANYYNRLATVVNEKFHSSVESKLQLSFLPIDTKEAKDYMNEMEYCIEFALANRKEMMDRMLLALREIMGKVEHGDMINKSHNFAAWENHYNTNVIVHRKGATQARKGELGMIPGSQGTNSYIVEGLGNPESFKSCSHGAGRKMSRKQARRELDFKKEVNALENKGIIHSLRHAKDLDEAPSSYKDINVVMENQKDLVNIVVKLTPLAVIKG